MPWNVDSAVAEYSSELTYFDYATEEKRDRDTATFRHAACEASRPQLASVADLHSLVAASNGCGYFGFPLGSFQLTLEHLGQRTGGLPILGVQACLQREQ